MYISMGRVIHHDRRHPSSFNVTMIAMQLPKINHALKGSDSQGPNIILLTAIVRAPPIQTAQNAAGLINTSTLFGHKLNTK